MKGMSCPNLLLTGSLLGAAALISVPASATVYEIAYEVNLSDASFEGVVNGDELVTVRIRYTDQGRLEMSSEASIETSFFPDAILDIDVTVGGFDVDVDSAGDPIFSLATDTALEDPNLTGWQIVLPTTSNTLMTAGGEEVTVTNVAFTWIGFPPFPQISVTDVPTDDDEAAFNQSGTLFHSIAFASTSGETQDYLEFFSEFTLTAISEDTDGDGIDDELDNCSRIDSIDTRDADEDGIGNLCDTDLNNDCTTNFLDLGILRSQFFSPDPVADFNGDGTVNFVDLGVLRQNFFSAPGISGTPNICSPEAE
ncbi:MAG: hypothetical protein AAF610_06095 [Pseudomonadota bacterium]